MKKLSILTIIFFLIIIIVITIYDQNKDIIIGEKEKIKEETNSSIAIMLQNDEGSYVKSTDNEWPTGGYAFNETYSSCENGSKLEWNIETGEITLISNISDKCYVYFDKILNLPSLEFKTVDSNITTDYSLGSWTNKTVKINIVPEDGINYEYSINNKVSWQSYDKAIELTSDINAIYYFRAVKGKIITEDPVGYNIKIDKTAPDVNISLGDKLIESSGKFTVDINSVSISDKGESGLVNNFSIYYKGQSEPESAFQLLGNNYTKETKKIEFTSDGNYNLKIIVRDNAGNETFKVYNVASSCFVAGTKVLTESGYKNIEDIRKGELVWTIANTTGEKELKPVLETITSEANELYVLTVGNETIKATPRHRFYVVDKGWVRAYNLQEGDYIVSTSNTSKSKIEKIEYQKLSNPIIVYNLEIEDNHNYIVSGEELVVHNSQTGGVEIGG